MCPFFPARSRLPARSNGRRIARLSPREMRRERDSPGCLIADIAPAIKPRMCRKCGAAQACRPCDKLRETGNESHPHPVCAPHDPPRADANPGIPAFGDAWRAVRRQRSAGTRAGGRRALRHRHAWRAGLAEQFQPSDLCQSGGAQRRPTGARRARHLRQPQSLHRHGPPGGQYPQLRDREPAGARL